MSADAELALRPEEIAQFNRDGYLGPFDLYDPDEMGRNLRSIRARLIDTKPRYTAGTRPSPATRTWPTTTGISTSIFSPSTSPGRRS